MIYCHISIKAHTIKFSCAPEQSVVKVGAKTTFYIFKYSIFYKIKKPVLLDRL